MKYVWMLEHYNCGRPFIVGLFRTKKGAMDHLKAVYPEFKRTYYYAPHLVWAISDGYGMNISLTKEKVLE